MKGPQLSKLVTSHILPGLHDFTYRKRLLYVQPVQDVLAGVYLDGSGDASILYVQAFVQPLYVPSAQLDFTFGQRLLNSVTGTPAWRTVPGSEAETFQRIGAAIRTGALMFLERLRTPWGLVTGLKTLLPHSMLNPLVRRGIGYSWVMVGDSNRACATLQSLIEPGALDLSVAWQKELAERAAADISEIRRDANNFRAQLRAWRDETARSLGV